MQELAQLVINGLTTGSVIAITAVGLSLVYGILKIVNFAHGEYLTLGAYVAFAFMAIVGIGRPASPARTRTSPSSRSGRR